MTGWRSTRGVVAAIGLAVALAACSGNDGSGPGEDEATTTVTQPTTTGSAPSMLPTTTTAGDGQTAAPTLHELRGDLDIDVLVVEPTTETGSHPTLSWQSAAGAASYRLVVRDGDGRPYWAWTGTDTSVRVGGGDRPDTNQTAALHEVMTWRVAAYDEQGSLIALSDTASVSP